MRSLVNRRIRGANGEYLVKKLIKVGGIASIYLGSSAGGDPVIIKEPLIDHQDGRGSIRLRRVKVEAEILRDEELINHPHVVRYVDEGECDGVFFLVIEYVDGIRLKDYSPLPIPEREAVRFTENLLETISFLHGKGILHRDLCPENIILRFNQDGKAGLDDFVIIDFNLAKRGLASPGYMENAPVGGRRGWSAPEQFSTPSHSAPSSDLYSVANILFYLLTGEAPYPRYLRSRLNIPLDLRKRLGANAVRAMEVATDENHLRRYQSAEDMLDALRGTFNPHIACEEGRIYKLGRITEIGRAHQCTTECRIRGFTRPLDLPIEDPKNYISKHHARIYVEANHQSYIVDLNSLNKTALKRKGEDFKVLTPNLGFHLKDGDEIAIVYDEKKGPYKVLRFRKR
ncbi:MAG: protein kinase [Candidatus Bathyarchaeia archaeon]